MSQQLTRKATSLFVKEIKRQFSIQRVLMFGSRARGDEHSESESESESDIDLAVLMEEENGDFFSLKMKLDDIAYDTLLETGLRIQALPVWQNEWRHPEHYSNSSLPYQKYSMRRGSPVITVDELMAKPKRVLASSQLLLAEEDADGACNRAYYAMFAASIICLVQK